MEDSYFSRLKIKMDAFVLLVYKVTKRFPKDEMFGITSQFRRASLSVVLNYIEGYSRFKEKVMLNFNEISYGSLQEALYLIYFSYKQGYLTEQEYNELMCLGNEVSKMLFGIIRKLKRQNK